MSVAANTVYSLRAKANLARDLAGMNAHDTIAVAKLRNYADSLDAEATRLDVPAIDSAAT